MRLDEWVAQARERLAACGVDAAGLEAQVIAAHAHGRDRGWVLTHGADAVQTRRMESPLARREAGEPLAYILGYREFYGRRFEVDPRVLIPRQETEAVVDVALAEVRTRPPGARVLDVGLGSGCIAVTIALETDVEVLGAESSPGALEVARENAARLGAKVDMRRSDMFEALGGDRFDVIVSNPPYVSPEDRLPLEVRAFEPSAALYADDGGRAAIDRLLREAPAHLHPGGLLVLEVGDGQAADTLARATAAGWAGEAFADLGGMARGVRLGRP